MWRLALILLVLIGFGAEPASAHADSRGGHAAYLTVDRSGARLMMADPVCERLEAAAAGVDGIVCDHSRKCADCSCFSRCCSASAVVVESAVVPRHGPDVLLCEAQRVCASISRRPLLPPPRA